MRTARVEEAQEYTGFPLFPQTKFPDFSSIFFHFSLTLIKYFYVLYSIFIFICLASTYYWAIALQVCMH